MSRMGDYFRVKNTSSNASHTHTLGNASVSASSSMFPQGYTSTTTGTTTTGTAGTIPTINFPPPSSLLDGEVTQIKGKTYRYSAIKEEWHEVIDAENKVTIPPAPHTPVRVDASSMLLALIEFKTFLEDIEGLPQETAEVIDDVVWGLDETILALNKLF